MKTMGNTAGFCLLAAAAVCAASCGNWRKPAEDQELAPVVKVMEVGDGGPGVSSRSYVGTVEADNVVTVSTNNPGTMGGLTLREGDRVRKGDAICKVESQSIRSAFRMAEATLSRAEDGYARIEKVYGSGSVSEVKMVEVRTDLENAKASFEAAQKSLWHCTVTAPISGTVSKVHAVNGEEVGLAAPVVTIVDTESSRVRIAVPENELPLMRAGDRAEVEIPALGVTLDAVLSSKGVVASPLSHSYDCLFRLEDAEGLQPGMVCKLRISTGTGTALVIPSSAVMTDGKGRYVWAVDENGTVCKTYIKVGGYSGNGIVVEEGLPQGQRVITEGSRKVSTGMKVRLYGDED